MKGIQGDFHLLHDLVREADGDEGNHHILPHWAQHLAHQTELMIGMVVDVKQVDALLQASSDLGSSRLRVIYILSIDMGAKAYLRDGDPSFAQYSISHVIWPIEGTGTGSSSAQCSRPQSSSGHLADKIPACKGRTYCLL